MRIVGVLSLILVAVTSYYWGRTVAVSPTVSAAQDIRTVSIRATKVDFATHVEPLLKSRCDGCHFSGGKMYDKLPFDRPETIRKLGHKLFTRISDENDRKVIREFLSQQASQSVP